MAEANELFLKDIQPDPDSQEFESDNQIVPDVPEQELNMKPGAVLLRSWLNKVFKVEMRDGRVLIGVFLCTDRDANVILGSCSEYLPPDPDGTSEEPRMLGLVMIPGRHIVSLRIDLNYHHLPDIGSPLLSGGTLDPNEIM